ncbi:SDR family oxidoreductase [Erythrobacter sp. THAF29]|uniref:SDR family oxidoreductase n=1 Tax=Erythrobacter sp. THAF29 TaxID=2587851 RepID=UPI00126979C6|nr:SDR family oxidoreductase [Erythrobacter sp. THAF29]QFT77833.1 NADP-dependent 3-hydroxy acid dehydrogenase YdfG [Erythrobacter sp. THAF29]
MTDINRRTLLAGAAATGALAATAKISAQDVFAPAPDLSGKSILITGCSTGFGRLSAEHFARGGARVFATMRNTPRAEAEELIQLADDEGLDLHVIEIDVMSDELVATGVAEAERINGCPIDVLINNAGISYGGPIEIQDMEATRHTFDTNVFGPQRLIRAVLPGMRKAKSGLIINVSSQLGRVIAPSYGMYSPSKFALEALSEGLAYELVPHGVDVTIIEPGGYPTMIWSNANKNSLALLARSEGTHTDGYPALVARLGQRTGGGSTDPMDVPRAMAEVIAMPAGTRPLRRPVHPGPKPQTPINELTARVQVEWLGASPFGPWVKAVHGA